jgi:hypothetical protein
LKCDDTGSILSEVRSSIESAYNNGSSVGFDKMTRIQSKNRTSDKIEVCETLYLGSRQSDRFIRIYDKGDVTRWEVEYKGKYAIEVQLELCTLLENMDTPTEVQSIGKRIKSMIFGCIDFVERTSKNLNRCERLPFWKAFLDIIDASRFKFASIIRAFLIDKKKAWIERSVIPSLAVLGLCDIGYSDILRQMISDAKLTLSDANKRILELFRIELAEMARN